MLFIRVPPRNERDATTAADPKSMYDGVVSNPMREDEVEDQGEDEGEDEGEHEDEYDEYEHERE